MAQRQVNARPSQPRQVVGELIIKIAFGADGVLRAGCQEQPFPACENPSTNNPVERTSAQSQIVSVNAALRRAGNFHFVELFLDAVGAAGGEFDPAKDAPTEREIFPELAIDEEIADQRSVALTGLGPAVNCKTLRAFERAINDRQIELHAKSIVEIVLGKELRDGTVEVLPRFVGHFLAVHLNSAEVAELLSDAGEK